MRGALDERRPASMAQSSVQHDRSRGPPPLPAKTSVKVPLASEVFSQCVVACQGGMVAPGVDAHSSCTLGLMPPVTKCAWSRPPLWSWRSPCLAFASTSANSVSFLFCWTEPAQSFLENFWQALTLNRYLPGGFRCHSHGCHLGNRLLQRLAQRTISTLRFCSLVAAPRQKHSIVCSILAPVTASTTSPRSQ